MKQPSGQQTNTARPEVVPLSQWTKSKGKPLVLPAKRQEYSGRPLMVTMKGQYRFQLLWSTTVGADLVVATADGDSTYRSTSNSVVLVRGNGSSLEYRWKIAADDRRSERWHNLRAIATAKAAAATLRERTAPAVASEAEAWLRKQLSTLNTNEGRI